MNFSDANILIVEDSISLGLLYEEYLTDYFSHIYQADNAQKAYFYLGNKTIDLVFLDFRLPDEDGDVVLKWIQENSPETAVVVITAHASVDIAVEMIQIGANDFLQKPIDKSRLITTAKNIIETQQLKSKVQQIESTYHKHNYHGFIGSSEPMQKVYQMIDAVASSHASVFITGESGTGKEVCASAIHEQSGRSDKPFIAINCSAIPKDLIESEVFGHIKGSFTGAIADRDGAAQQAHGGTLFLDEIGEMDLNLQSKLLRFIQTGSVKKVGSSKEERVDVRFICATNRNPLNEIKESRFREDLYYRLNVVPLHLTPLRERGNDILELAEFFLSDCIINENKNAMKLSEATKKILMKYEWPGNIRQLQNVVHNIVVFNDKEIIDVDDLPPPLDVYKNTYNSAINPSKASSNINNIGEHKYELNSDTYLDDEVINNNVEIYDNDHHLNYFYYDESGKPVVRSLADIEREIIEGALSLYDNNINKVATFLEVSPSTIYRKKQHWDAHRKH